MAKGEISTQEFYDAWKNGTLEETLLKAAQLAEKEEQQNPTLEQPSLHEKLKSGEPFTQNGVTFTPHSNSGPVSWSGWPKDSDK